MKIKLIVVLASTTFCSLTYASGFAIQEQSITGLGKAFAGSAAVADDASTIFFNPAGLTQLDMKEIDLGLNFIFPQSDFKNNGSAVPDFGGAGGFSGQALTGGGDKAGKDALVPNFYYAHPVNDKIVLGLGVGAPFGLVTEYSDTWIGRYHAVKSDLKTININPTIAYEVNDRLSLGFGIDLQYIDVELSQIADLGALGGFPQAADGKVKLEADDWSWGYNLGLTYLIQDETRLGIAYRSKISHKLRGDGKLTNASGSLLADERAKANVTLPESLSVALHHQVNQQWAVMADASWTRWSRFQELVINSTNNTFNQNKPEKWENTMRYGLGVTYMHNDKWTFRSGIAYDETPISNEFRTARIPGNDRKWIAVGASYKSSKNLTLDVGYSHLFVSDSTINETDSNGYNLSGKYKGSVDLLGIQARYLFI
jgi:long-chain fatty acid transport protein